MTAPERGLEGELEDELPLIVPPAGTVAVYQNDRDQDTLVAVHAFIDGVPYVWKGMYDGLVPAYELNHRHRRFHTIRGPVVDPVVAVIPAEDPVLIVDNADEGAIVAIAWAITASGATRPIGDANGTPLVCSPSFRCQR